MHKASILRKLHSQFPVYPPPAPSESYLPWHQPPSHTPTPEQSDMDWAFLLLSNAQKKNLRPVLPLKFGFHTAAGAIGNENKEPLTDTSFFYNEQNTGFPWKPERNR